MDTNEMRLVGVCPPGLMAMLTLRMTLMHVPIAVSLTRAMCFGLIDWDLIGSCSYPLVWYVRYGTVWYNTV